MTVKVPVGPYGSISVDVTTEVVVDVTVVEAVVVWQAGLTVTVDVKADAVDVLRVVVVTVEVGTIIEQTELMMLSLQSD